MQDYITYEHPLNERIRMMLRLEHLFLKAGHFIEQDTIWAARVFVSTLLDILELFSRGDIRTELLKELEHSTENLSLLLRHDSVDHQRLGSILRALEHLVGTIHAMSAAPGSELKSDELLSQIRHRITIPGGTCDFDLPRFNLWLHGDLNARQDDCTRWISTLDPIRKTIELLLKMIRGSAEFVGKTATNGSFTEQLDKSLPYHMVRVKVSAKASYHAEISGSKHRFTIRFLSPDKVGKGKVVTSEVPFQLAICRL